MKPIKYALVGVLALITALWSLSDTMFPEQITWFALRKPIVQYSGIIAIVAMSLAMILATRPVWLEKPLDGLDKMYRLHKWLGITALSSAVVHWWFAKGTKWMVGWGWLARPERGKRPEIDPATLEGWLITQRHHAEIIGEWAFYVAAILLVLALIKWFPYHWFAKTHKWLAALFLGFVFHSFVLMNFSYWTEPVGIVVALCLIAGTVSAVLVLLGKVGKQRKVAGKVAALKHYPEAATLEVTIELESGWRGHAAGQFAFVTFADKPHPFTIASAWDKEKGSRLVFLIKALGDYTEALPRTLQIGQSAVVEGPYGRFTFDGSRARQIWVGAGCGVTPFLAKLEALAKERGTTADVSDQPIDLFHPVAVCPPDMEQKLKEAAEAAGVRLHLIVSPRDGFLTGERIRSLVPDWKNASLWFCGPAAFGQTLRADFAAQGVSLSNFHQELFEMR
ncbi:MAG: ferric reductase-like transmembrane domain-containing protein [Betaproteobacteria bacterium]|nr:ferric reductase-like transmembrane domain-containing protein [Betaproteobacteria bacterium]